MLVVLALGVLLLYRQKNVTLLLLSAALAVGLLVDRRKNDG